MSDLAEFLNARLDDEQRNAEEAAAQWPASHFTVEPGSLVIVKFHRDHDPARVLREVDAKRKILALYEFHSATSAPDGASMEELGASMFDAAARQTLEGMMLRMAAVYSAHPDYDPAWA